MLKTGVAAIIGLGLVACAKEEKSAVSDAIEAEEARDATENAEREPSTDEGGLAAQDLEHALNAAKAPTEEELAQQAADNAAEAEKYFSEYTKKEGVIVTESGLHYEILEEGPKDGLSPGLTDLIAMNYAATTLDGIEFDSSARRGAAARVQVQQLFLPGLIEGIQLMSAGDRYRFSIPSELAFGENSAGPLEPNSAMIFDIELLNVTNPAIALKASLAFLEENKKKKGIVTTESGLQYEIISEGPADGKSPTEVNRVEVDYEGKLINGTIFDSSYARGQPIDFGVTQVIAGWTEGLQLMSEGDKFRFFIPPDLAYGEAGGPGGGIGPNEALIFEVELHEVQS